VMQKSGFLPQTRYVMPWVWGKFLTIPQSAGHIQGSQRPLWKGCWGVFWWSWR